MLDGVSDCLDSARIAKRDGSLAMLNLFQYPDRFIISLYRAHCNVDVLTTFQMKLLIGLQFQPARDRQIDLEHETPNYTERVAHSRSTVFRHSRMIMRPPVPRQHGSKSASGYSAVDLWTRENGTPSPPLFRSCDLKSSRVSAMLSIAAGIRRANPDGANLIPLPIRHVDEKNAVELRPYSAEPRLIRGLDPLRTMRAAAFEKKPTLVKSAGVSRQILALRVRRRLELR